MWPEGAPAGVLTLKEELERRWPQKVPLLPGSPPLGGETKMGVVDGESLAILGVELPNANTIWPRSCLRLVSILTSRSWMQVNHQELEKLKDKHHIWR
jgi:hypothetical protein